MAQIPSGTGFTPRGRTDNDIYTVLMIVGFGFVLATIIYVIYRSVDLFGTAFPGFS